jgi:ribosomal protein S18 acetylase RimI-like enzyme
MKGESSSKSVPPICCDKRGSAQVHGSSIVVRNAEISDVSSLLHLEACCFQTDRLSARSFKHHIRSEHAELVIAETVSFSKTLQLDDTPEILGYALLLLRRGTQLTRLYSIAVSPHARGKGVAVALIRCLEEVAKTRGKPVMRLEVSGNNHEAIALYNKLGFVTFGMYENYYADQSNAIRMQKRLSAGKPLRHGVYPWYQQTTDFTCGPAALMMAMHHLDKTIPMHQQMELEIWRKATTIYMTSGHGGCHPIGLGLAALTEGFKVKVLINQPNVLFVDGVRSAHKKAVITQVEKIFHNHAQQANMPVLTVNWGLEEIEDALKQGSAVLCLISVYALNKKKAPHWVTVTGYDRHCFYLHDPDADNKASLEFQHIPVARDDFLRLACYGKRKIGALVIISK